MKKIMFNDKYGLTAAVLAGTKTQTRRLVPEKWQLHLQKCWEDANSAHGCPFDKMADAIIIRDKAPFKVGEVVAVAQKYRDLPSYACSGGNSLQYTQGWDNKMFVEAVLMPHQIEIADIRVQRLQEISDEDCIAEGVWKSKTGFHSIQITPHSGCYYTYESPQKAFAALTDSISGKGTWARNPWVFVYELKLVR